ncbi:11494_t:CDS:1 [Entrophospora sp. SA101]|nr:11494_t:CDS:1 [Entrophospora sp. SA101]
METQNNSTENTENETNGTFYHRGHNAESVSEYSYKIHDDTVNPREFLGTDNEDGIESILTDRKGHSLHKFIDGDDPLCPFIDFDLPQETFNKIEPKLACKEILDLLCNAFIEVCLEIYTDWDKNTLAIANSSDSQKMSFHISTFGMRLKNISKVALFTELVRKKLPIGLQSKDIVDNIAKKSIFSLQILGTPKIVKETGKHVCVKKPSYPKDSSVFNFMLCPPHDESPVVDSLILDVQEAKASKNGKSEARTFGSEVEFIERLLEEYKIEGFEVLYPSLALPNIFPLNRRTESQCPLCNQVHNSDNAYVVRNKKTYRYYCHRADLEMPSGIKKPSLKLVINETVKNQEKTLPILEKIEQPRISDPNDHFVWGDLIRMCTSKKNFTRNEVYNAIQATLACVVRDKRTWILKHRKPDGRLYFGMAPTLDFGKITINIVELGGEPIKLISLIDCIYDSKVIIYDDINFLPYPPNIEQPKNEFFNLFLGFKAKPAPQINYDLVNPIIWHIENIWCDGNKVLSSYALKWLAFLVQYPAIIPGTILVLRSPPRCGKNIITDFIRKSLFGPELVYSMSDLGKILGKFNSSIQGRKLIIMNEAGMLSGEWHKSNDHLKSLITEDYVSIERKGLENQECGHFPGFIVLSNHDAPIHVEQGDGCIVCLDVSPRCKGNFKYFSQLGKILNHPDTPGSFMSYLLDQDLSNWNPQENIPTTKMKTETMHEHLPNPIHQEN